LFDLTVTVILTEIQALPFHLVELNPIARLYPYPLGFIFYKILITLCLIPIFYFISKKYRKIPMMLNGLFIITLVGGLISQT
jgi:hypothetical protein